MTCTCCAEREAALAELKPLTPREREALVLVAKGFTTRQVAEILRIAEATAADHLQRTIHKLHMTRIEAAVLASKAGLV